jgi:Predicted dehydrogenases and related proteins|uniref:Gfo/Idh/MocA family oxidoreductase n=1 Tax=Ignisphaera aggregans TaxID=334771 RepID=A0A7J3Z8F8_9CREN
MIKVGVIGVGKWGRNHVRVLKELENDGKVKLEAICDIREEVLENVRKEFSIPIAKTDYVELLKHVDAVVIATPIDLLAKVSKDALAEGRHALIEKPVATTSREAETLLEIATENNVIAMPGMIMRFNGAVIALKELLRKEPLLYIILKRMSRRPKNMVPYPILLDLGVHDIDLCRYLTEDEVATVIKAHRLAMSYDEVIIATLRMKKGVYCHIHIDGVSPYKVREIDAITESSFIRVDTNTNRVAVYSATGERIIPVEVHEPLKKELQWFIEVVKAKPRQYQPNLHDAINYLRIAEAISTLL